MMEVFLSLASSSDSLSKDLPSVFSHFFQSSPNWFSSLLKSLLNYLLLIGRAFKTLIPGQNSQAYLHHTTSLLTSALIPCLSPGPGSQSTLLGPCPACPSSGGQHEMGAEESLRLIQLISNRRR